MKKTVIILAIIVLGAFGINAQVPYFAGTVGDGHLYGYTSLKFRPGINVQETYTTFQYGISNYGAAGLDLYTSNGNAYTGILIRGGYKANKWFGIGVQLTPSFNLSHSFQFSYLTTGIYMNGNITRNGRLFWCSNTWLIINNGAKNTFTNWEYIGLNIPIKNCQSISPMIGAIHSWEFNQNVDLSIGAYYSLRQWNFYLWSNDFFKKNPRIVVGVDFVM